MVLFLEPAADKRTAWALRRDDEGLVFARRHVPAIRRTLYLRDPGAGRSSTLLGELRPAWPRGWCLCVLALALVSTGSFENTPWTSYGVCCGA